MKKYSRIPTREDFLAYDGAHCKNLWRRVDDDWRCPACQRSKFEILHWTKRSPGGCTPFMGWMAALHEHHDHLCDHGGFLPRFQKAIICGQCNAVDGAAKRELGLPSYFSFSPDELRVIVSVSPHKAHLIDLARAAEIAESQRRFFFFP